MKDDIKKSFKKKREKKKNKAPFSIDPMLKIEIERKKNIKSMRP
jgi:hypothetical protein